MADRHVLLEQLSRHPSFYLYEESVIQAAASRLQSNFPDAQFLYSMKCNPAGRVLDTDVWSGLRGGRGQPGRSPGR